MNVVLFLGHHVHDPPDRRVSEQPWQAHGCKPAVAVIGMFVGDHWLQGREMLKLRLR